MKLLHNAIYVTAIINRK